MRATRQVQDARRRLYATDAQICYLRRLLNEAFGKLYNHPFNLDVHHLEGVTKAYASTAISGLVEAKNRGWK